jgi:GGDEF domain-containing protein
VADHLRDDAIAIPKEIPVHPTVTGNPRLRLAGGAPPTPAERLQELATPAELHARFAQLQEICERISVPMLAVVIHFEGIDRLRDELGGDAALRALAAGATHLGESMREGDEYGRWSEDELAVFCPGADPAAVNVFAQAIVASLEQVQVRHELRHDVQITLPLRITATVIADISAATGEAAPMRHLHVA